MGFDARKNIQNTHPNYLNFLFAQDFAALSWSFSPSPFSPMWSISWDQEASMPWFQAENHPFISPNSRHGKAKHKRLTYLLIYVHIYIYYIILYYVMLCYVILYYIIYICNVSHMFFKQIWMNLTYDTFCYIYSDIYPHISKHIFWHLFQHIFWRRGRVFDPKFRVLESKDPHLTCRA